MLFSSCFVLQNLIDYSPHGWSLLTRFIVLKLQLFLIEILLVIYDNYLHLSFTIGGLRRIS